MKTQFNKLMLSLSLGMALVGCGGGGSGGSSPVAPSSPTIVIVNGLRGYYLNGAFCSYLNNYCGTGQSYSIVYPAIIVVNGYYGYYSGATFCNYSNNYCGSGLSWGIGSGGDTYTPPSYGGGSTGNGSGNGSTGNGSGNGSGYDYGSGNGSGNGSGYDYGSGNSSGNSSGNGSGYDYGSGNSSGNGSGYDYGSGNSSGNGSGYNYGSGNSSGNGSGYNYGSGNSSGNGSGNYYYYNNGSGNGSGNYSSNNSGNGSGNGCNFCNSTGRDTKDVDLQRADLVAAQYEGRAQDLANSFDMNIDAARQLVQVSDRMAQVTKVDGSMTDADREALTSAALGVAGVSKDDVLDAYSKQIKDNDSSGVDSLVNKAAANLGMPSAAGLRDQILPSLGINLGAPAQQ